MLAADRRELSIEWIEGVQRIPLAWAKMHFGEAPLFAPEDGPRCTSLHLAEGRFVSRRTLGLAYLSQRMDREERHDLRLAKITERLAGAQGRRGVRGAVRTRLVNELKSKTERLSPEAWEQVDAAAATLRAKRRRRPLKGDPPQSTRWALLRGRVNEPRLTSAEVLRRLSASWLEKPASIRPSGLSPSSSAVAPRSDHPELDLRVLRPRPGRARGHKLVWGDGDDRRTALAALFGEGAACRLLIEIWSAGAVTARQEVATARGRRPGDLFLVCPVTGGRVLKLHLREGRFASAQAQRLR